MYFNFIRESLQNWTEPKKKDVFFAKRPFLLGEIWRSTLSRILKKSYLEGIFEFLHPDPQLDQKFKLTGNFCGQLLTIYISIHIYDLYTHKV